jgi:dTMP kinase
MSATAARYIVLEGDEGAGKTEQLSRIKGRLENEGLRVEIVREPGGDAFAEQMRQILKHAEYHIPPVAEVLGFSAARASMIANVVRPLLDSDTWVLSDRSYLSTLVYQGLGHELDNPEFRQVVEYAIQAAPPDLTVVIDVSLEEAQHRQDGRGLPKDRFDLDYDFRSRINTGYREFKSNDQLVHVDGHGTFQEVEDRIMSALARVVPAKL